MPDIKKVLVVDDERDIRDVITIILTKSNFSVTAVENGVRAIEVLKSDERFDLIIMDIMMPEMSGIETVSKIREFTDCPVLFLTAKFSDEDKVGAYEAGGDDFLVKPFSRVELLLRINALIKRCSNTANGLVVDSKLKRISKNGKTIHLTEKEFELIEFLYVNSGHIYSVEELYENVWKEKFLSSSSNTVMVHILNLRKKIEKDHTRPEIIKTVWGKGYTYADS